MLCNGNHQTLFALNSCHRGDVPETAGNEALLASVNILDDNHVGNIENNHAYLEKRGTATDEG